MERIESEDMTQHRDAELKIEGLAPIPLRVVQGTEGCLAIDVGDLYRNTVS